MFVNPLRKRRIKRICEFQALIVFLEDNAEEVVELVSQIEFDKLMAEVKAARDKLMTKTDFSSDQLARVNFMLKSQT